MARWFRMYDELLDDPKVQKLSPELFKIWVNTLALASRNNGSITLTEDVSFAFRMRFIDVSHAFKQLAECGLLDVSKNVYRPHNWNKRQYKSDTSTERVKRFRTVSKTVTETPPDTDTDTDTEQIEKNNINVVLKETRGTRLPDDFLPDEKSVNLSEELRLTNSHCQNELDKFRDYWRSVPGAKGRKIDWQATFRNWLRNSKVKTNGQSPRNPSIADTLEEFGNRIESERRRIGEALRNTGERDEGSELLS